MSVTKKSALRARENRLGYVGLSRPGDGGGAVKGAGTAAVIAAVSLAGFAGMAIVGDVYAQDAPNVPKADVVACTDGAVVSAADSTQVRLSQVQGAFGFTQGEVTPTAQIAHALGGARQVLCGASAGVVAGSEATVSDAAEWQVTVDGDGVQAGLTATIGELAQAGTQSTVMGCSCAGNPADGRATVNADVTGISVLSMIEAAGGLSEGANAITFVSSDGYEVTLPLAYVLQRASMIVYQVNGEPLSASVGGTNQLWLGSTSARYFASDVVEVRVMCERQVPAAPGAPESGDRAANLPNVGMSAGAAQA